MMWERVNYPDLSPYTLLVLISVFFIMVFDIGSGVFNGEI